LTHVHYLLPLFCTFTVTFGSPLHRCTPAIYTHAAFSRDTFTAHTLLPLHTTRCFTCGFVLTVAAYDVGLLHILHTVTLPPTTLPQLGYRLVGHTHLIYHVPHTHGLPLVCSCVWVYPHGFVTTFTHAHIHVSLPTLYTTLPAARWDTTTHGYRDYAGYAYAGLLRTTHFGLPVLPTLNGTTFTTHGLTFHTYVYTVCLRVTPTLTPTPHTHFVTTDTRYTCGTLHTFPAGRTPLPRDTFTVCWFPHTHAPHTHYTAFVHYRVPHTVPYRCGWFRPYYTTHLHRIRFTIFWVTFTRSWFHTHCCRLPFYVYAFTVGIRGSPRILVTTPHRAYGYTPHVCYTTTVCAHLRLHTRLRTVALRCSVATPPPPRTHTALHARLDYLLFAFTHRRFIRLVYPATWVYTPTLLPWIARLRPHTHSYRLPVSAVTYSSICCRSLTPRRLPTTLVYTCHHATTTFPAFTLRTTHCTTRTHHTAALVPYAVYYTVTRLLHLLPRLHGWFVANVTVIPTLHNSRLRVVVATRSPRYLAARTTPYGSSRGYPTFTLPTHIHPVRFPTARTTLHHTTTTLIAFRTITPVGWLPTLHGYGSTRYTLPDHRTFGRTPDVGPLPHTHATPLICRCTFT